MNPTDVSRIEGKVDKLTIAIEQLVLLNERQTVQAAAITSLQTVQTKDREAQQATAAKLDRWINMGVGAWAVAMSVFGVVKVFL